MPRRSYKKLNNGHNLIMPLLIILILPFFSMQALAEWYLVKAEKVANYRLLNGEIEAVNKALVSSQTAGRGEKLYYDVDDFVAKDSIIVEITNTEQKAQLEQAKANAKAALITYNQAQLDYERTKDVYAKKLISKSKLDQALSNMDALKAKSAAADAAVINAKKQLEYTIIRAPYDGIVTNRFVELGETVNPGKPIMEGLSLNKLRVITHIPERIINKVKSNPDAMVLNNGKQIQSQNITIFPYADKNTRTFKTRIELEQSEGNLFPGMTVKVMFRTGETDALLIPQTAIINRSELIMVYVKDGDNKILRHIKLGTQHGDKVEVIAGINSNEQVLINPLSSSVDK